MWKTHQIVRIKPYTPTGSVGFHGSYPAQYLRSQTSSDKRNKGENDAPSDFISVFNPGNSLVDSSFFPSWKPEPQPQPSSVAAAKLGTQAQPGLLAAGSTETDSVAA
jgi:hypothetical protein